jgi:hypothetical protein
MENARLFCVLAKESTFHLFFIQMMEGFHVIIARVFQLRNKSSMWGRCLQIQRRELGSVFT